MNIMIEFSTTQVPGILECGKLHISDVTSTLRLIFLLEDTMILYYAPRRRVIYDLTLFIASAKMVRHNTTVTYFVPLYLPKNQANTHQSTRNNSVPFYSSDRSIITCQH